MDIRSLTTTLKGFFNLSDRRARYRTIRKRIHEGAKIDGIHICQLIAAMLIASIGLNIDSTEAIIGSMLICPLMGSVLAMAYAIATIDGRFMRESVMGFVVQIVICLLTSTLYFALSPLSRTTSELLTNSSATIWDVMIAFAGGFVGEIAYSRKQEPSTLVAGVAVATSLMPPLCSTGFGMGTGDWVLAIAAFYKFLINVVFIAFGAEIVLVWLHVPLMEDLNGDGVITREEHAEAIERSWHVHRRVIICSLMFAIPCVFITASIVGRAMDQEEPVFQARDEFQTQYTTYELEAVCPKFVAYSVGELESYDTDKSEVVERVVATVQTSEELSQEQKEQIEALVRLNVSDLDTIRFEVVEEE